MRFLAVAALLVVAAVCTAADPQPPKGFTALFNGKDFTGWKGWDIHPKGNQPPDLAKLTPEERQKKFDTWTAALKDHWTIEDGALVNKGTGPFLASEKDYGDFELLIEYKLTATCDAGIYPKGIPQIQVWDPEDPAQVKNGNAKGSGGLWNNKPDDAVERFPLVKADKKAGEWNQFRIIVLGERCTVYLNDKLVVEHARLQNYYDRTSPVQKAAPFLLQTHAPKLPIHWRNIFIREIPAAEANEILAKKAGDGFKEVFNGKDFTGWQGATANYEVVDGAVRCKKDKSGVLFTKDEYADFQVQMEIKFPKGSGNNGLAVRYPGKGDGAYDGMTELQVLNDDYKGIDPRQSHGSAYGMVAAARGYQRPQGEWNFQTVTVKGSTLKVELNGTQILDADLSKVTDYMGGKPHPGKDFAKGFFGFCGHGDAVEFRNVKIKELK